MPRRNSKQLVQRAYIWKFEQTLRAAGSDSVTKSLSISLLIVFEPGEEEPDLLVRLRKVGAEYLKKGITKMKRAAL